MLLVSPVAAIEVYDQQAGSEVDRDLVVIQGQQRRYCSSKSTRQLTDFAVWPFPQYDIDTGTGIDPVDIRSDMSV